MPSVADGRSDTVETHFGTNIETQEYVALSKHTAISSVLVMDSAKPSGRTHPGINAACFKAGFGTELRCRGFALAEPLGRIIDKDWYRRVFSVWRVFRTARSIRIVPNTAAINPEAPIPPSPYTTKCCCGIWCAKRMTHCVPRGQDAKLILLDKRLENELPP
jgi:hypothetical protein